MSEWLNPSTSAYRLTDLGWSTEHDHQFLPYRGTHVPARVARVERGGVDVLGAAGTLHVTYGGSVLAAAAADHTQHPAAGDWVAIARWPDGRLTLEAILPRRTVLTRDSSNRTSHGQVVAANVDLVVIVEHLDPDSDLGRIERLLVLAWSSGATPLVVLTKADLVPDPERMREEVVAVAPGVDVLAVDATADDGATALRQRLGPDVTMTFVGPSGAGKSTLVNAIAGANVMATNEVRGRDGKGRHTTTHRELVVVPGHGVVIDTPGLRAVGLIADPDDIADAFPDIDELAGECRFRDCAHEAEPGCAVLAAAGDGELDKDRLARWRKLRREAAYQARRADARLRREELARSKRRAKALRQHYRARGR
ncbi:ribosome small subunit-dependent GTPase A [Actinobacteria bacterium YIM 96077]|uniref:Small ribosomal subunit biogenesis GTPase RsgA n=1 Tax=Phytoactinopolyspora halophila TaxID=1981511 RepID=A0A329R1M2_9ACTN|nr:ribosome small subunit-dependent GTPase A [Phytoactinopolyspora halophila]AYY13383.1 ribosome small subunit-dependent GTPase A [Actinobacteria bacterium YIM 96077]RAW17382.1 ribosome small subunit-dependent GTPase A [Phytoactinopolyspora halophila]